MLQDREYDPCNSLSKDLESHHLSRSSVGASQYALGERTEEGIAEMKVKSICAVLTYILLFADSGLFSAEEQNQSNLKTVKVFLEGDTSSIPKFINLCRQQGPERGINFQFVDKKEDSYDYRVVLSTEGTGLWDYAHGNIVVMNTEAKVIFTVTRANRLTSKGSASALAKEFIKVLARYIGTHK